MSAVTTSTPTPTTGQTPNGRAGASAAGIAAAGYGVIIVLAIVANFLALGSVLEPGQPEATANALAEHASMVRLGALAFLGIALADVVVAWALHVLLSPVHRDLSLLAAWFRLAYTVVLLAAVSLLVVAVWISETGGALGPAQDGAVLLTLATFDLVWVVGLAAFGAHLLVVADLMRRARGPRWLAALLAAAGAAYLLDSAAHLVIADYQAHADLFLAMVAIPSVVGEVGLGVWLAGIALRRRPAPTA